MSRALITLHSDRDRFALIRLINEAPKGTRVEIKSAQRSIDQNSRFWAMLTDISRQAEHGGRKYTADAWKVIFLHAIGHEVQFLPSLDGKAFVPWGQSSSDLSKSEMGDLMEFMSAWGAEHNIEFHESGSAGSPPPDRARPAPGTPSPSRGHQSTQRT